MPTATTCPGPSRRDDSSVSGRSHNMSGGPSVEQHIDAVDAFARTLYLEARGSPSVADAVRQLHIALRHLRIETSEPDSPFTSAPYSTQIRLLVDECGVALRQLEDALGDGRRGDQLAGSVRRLRERIDGFLDGVQLQGRTGTLSIQEQPPVRLDNIKEKVDKVARKVFARRDSGFGDDEDRLWLEFESELEKEGFAPEVLRKHKDILRAYIRGLEAMALKRVGAPPTVQGLIEYEAETSSPRELQTQTAPSSDRFATSPRTRGPSFTGAPPPIPPKEPLPELPVSSRADSPPPDDSDSDSMALISTRDLVAMDRLDMDAADMQMATRNYHQSQDALYGTSPQKYLPSSAKPAIEGPNKIAELAGSPSMDLLGVSPPTTYLPTYSNLSSPPPVYGGSPRMSNFRLGPDGYGNEIPMDAQWTRINRDRVSPEVLQRAGVRYEARPTYVAVLGRLSREQVEDYARQTADCRAARYVRQSTSGHRSRGRGDSRGSYDNDINNVGNSQGDFDQDDDDLYDDESDLFYESDTTDADDDKTSDKGTKSYPYIVSPDLPGKEKGSLSSSVPPKSILKNRNENHVRFDPEPHEVSSRSLPRERSRDQDSERERGQPRERDRYHDRRRRDHGGRYGSDAERDWDHRQRRYHDNRDRERDQYLHPHYQAGRRPAHRDGADRRAPKKKGWGAALGAAGIGGVAVSLLGVLAEASGV